MPWAQDRLAGVEPLVLALCLRQVLIALQLDNVLLDGSQPLPIIKMCDFGYSKDEVAGSLCKTACGTPEYMAPEVRPRSGSSCWVSSYPVCVSRVR